MADPTGYKFQLINSDGTRSQLIIEDRLWGWGRSYYGELGNGTTVYYSSPIQIGSLSNWKEIYPGTYHFLSIKTDWTLWSWGSGDFGQLGNGQGGFNTMYSSPIQIGSLTNWSQADGGFYHSVAIKTDKTLWTWGQNTYGELGNGTIDRYSSPIQIGSLTDWKQISASYYYTASVKTDGTLWTWGNNGYGQLGNETTDKYSSPIQVGALTDWNQVTAGSYNWASIKADGSLWACGRNDYGQLGNGATDNYSSPIQIGALTDWQQISLSKLGYNSVAVKIDGTLWAWGDNTYGQLGNGNTLNYSSPIQVGSLSNWSKVSTSGYRVTSTKTDETLWTWGRNNNGQLGIGNTIDYSSPIQISSSSGWKKLATAEQVSLVIYEKTSPNNADIEDIFLLKDQYLTAGLWGCGLNGGGQIGNGTTVNYSSPVQIGSLTTWKQVSSQAESNIMLSAAVKTDGTLWTWGQNNNGQLGNGTTLYYSSPIQVGSLTNWKQVSAGTYVISAVKTDGTLWAWGAGGNGALGNGTTINYSSPVQVGLLTNWKQVSVGESYAVASKTDGTLWTWGYNAFGNLGNSTTVKYSSPIQVGSLTNWSYVFTKFYTVFAIKTDGTLWGCGYGSYGRLGNGARVNYSSPVQVGSSTDWKQVSVNAITGSGYAAGIRKNGTLWVWGNDSGIGNLGLGTGIVNYSSPVQVGSLTDWKQVSCGYRFMSAVKTDGTLWAWGGSLYGALGNGTTITYSSPIQIGALNTWKQVAASDTLLAIQSPDLP